MILGNRAPPASRSWDARALNWFDVATAFPPIRSQFHVGLGSVSLLIPLYVVGYALSHIPGGMPATRIGMKRAIVAGLAVQGASGDVGAIGNYPELATLPGHQRYRRGRVRRRPTGGFRRRP